MSPSRSILLKGSSSINNIRRGGLLIMPFLYARITLTQEKPECNSLVIVKVEDGKWKPAE